MRTVLNSPLFVYTQHENGIGDESSLQAIRQLYPGDIKDYPPKSRKVS